MSVTLGHEMVKKLFFCYVGGFLFSWGDNKHGQLGIGNSSPVHNVPEHVSSLCGVPFALICAGGYHSFALSLSGALFSWGRNKSVKFHNFSLY